MSEFGNTVICGSLFTAKFQNKSTQPNDATNKNLESNRIFQKNTVFIDRDQLYIDEERSALEITFFYRINK